MKPANHKLLQVGLCLLMTLLCLSGCAQSGEPEPTVPKWRSLREKAQYLTVIAEEADFALLEECVNLEYLDLSGSTCYDAILHYVQSHPQVEVVYTVPLGNLVLSNSDTQAKLGNVSYSAESLMKQLKYLPNLTSLELPKTFLTAEEVNALREAYPGIDITYTVELAETEYGPQDTSADLSALLPEDVMDAAGKLAMLPNLAEADLMKADGTCHLSMEDVKVLMDAAPHVSFHYTFDLFGKTVSTTDERIEFEGVSIGDGGEAQIRAALDILPACTYFKLENCGMSNEVLASIRDDYPDTKVVWRISFGGQYSLLTDETTLRTVYGVENSHNEVLKYCTDLKYIDMGHNTELTDISFVEYMPDLEIVILSGSMITDLEPFANHKKLEWLELANCYALTDISALESCDNLRFLNICFSKVTDLTPIEDLPLERFLYLSPKVDQETRTAFQESHPDCLVRFTGSDPYSLYWRYNDVGITMFDYYLKIRDIFDYDGVDRRVAAQEEAKRRQEEANRPAETTPPATESPAPGATTPPEETTPPATDPPATDPPATDPPAPPAADPPAPPAEETPVAEPAPETT